MSAVREALHVSTAPSTIVCREDEQKKVLEFCKKNLEEEKAGSLYVCGCPGTGKSLSMEKVQHYLVDWAKKVYDHSHSCYLFGIEYGVLLGVLSYCACQLVSVAFLLLCICLLLK